MENVVAYYRALEDEAVCRTCCGETTFAEDRVMFDLYLRFPNEPTLRLAWLQAVGKEDWQPKERSAICSEHFLCDDLYETKSGLRKVRSGAVPIILQACRICLAMDVKLFPIRKYKLEQAYEQIFGMTIEDNDKLPQKLCPECITHLISFKMFRNKGLRAHSLLLEILKRQDSLTSASIKTINRNTNRLCSNLVEKHFIPQYYDLSIDATDDSDVKIEKINEVEPTLHEVNIEVDVAVKNEELSNVNQLYYDEDTANYSDDDGDDPKDEDYKEDDVVKNLKTVPELEEECEIKPKRRKSRRDLPEKKLKVKKVKKDPTEPKIDRRRRPFLNDDLNETLFTITDLTMEEQVAEIEKRQESTNFKNSKYKCMKCFKGFLDEDAYNSHSLRHAPECGEHECEVCRTRFKNRHALRKHITAHHTQRFSCNQCPYTTTHRQTARLHERWHRGTKYQCPHCGDDKFTTYMGHIRIKHPSDFVCALCGYSFVSEKGIELHKKLKHRLDTQQIPADGPYCEPCGVRFVSADAHKRHLMVSARHADNATPKEPNAKPKSRRNRENGGGGGGGGAVREHRARAKKQRDPNEPRKVYPSQMRKAQGPIDCEQCGMQLEDSRAYHGHFRRMHPDKNRTHYPSMRSPCMCEICGRVFQSFALLKDHTYIHTGEKPFKCELCPKSFRMKQRLVAHRRVHAQVRASYSCGVCSKTFSTHSNRQRHMFIHTGLKPFKCEMCGKCFKHASEKRAHITYVHLKKPWPKRQRAKRHVRPSEYSVHESTAAPELQHPAWPCQDPKIDLNPMLDDKPMYYNLKI
ncbi:Zinc finger protein 658 [Eumeta japonica]|uniref:Zinc finger protein 658 n=1 Tax=Eumeta variegata TaxID=151549 RepID=A0A4C1THB4_EUMVA|nr:Zinc finger protein 658 [Eumeta japonica]